MIVSKAQNTFDLSEENFNILSEFMEDLFFRKGDIIVSAGSRDDFIYFIDSGFVRAYMLKDGKYRTFFFASDGNIVATSFDFTSSNQYAKLTIEAIAPTRLLRITKKQLEQIFNQSIEFANWGRKVLEKQVVSQENYFFNYFWDKKSTQYTLLVKEYPELVQKIPLKDLATYLNITPQSLSRIRAKKD